MYIRSKEMEMGIRLRWMDVLMKEGSIFLGLRLIKSIARHFMI